MTSEITPTARRDVFSAGRIPYPRAALRAERQLVVAYDTGCFTTYHWLVARDVASGLLAVVDGAVGVVRSPADLARCLPWSHFSVRIPGLCTPATRRLAQDPARICAGVNRHIATMRELIADSGAPIVVSQRPLEVDDIDYDGPYQRISPLCAWREQVRSYAAAQATPLTDVLFASRAAARDWRGVGSLHAAPGH